jgi:hypothetical protein
MDRSPLYRLEIYHVPLHLDLMTLLPMKNDPLTSVDLHRSEEEECTLPIFSDLPQLLKPEHSFAVQPCPSDILALSNRLIVHPSDFKDGEHVLVKGEFPLTVKCVKRRPFTHFGVNCHL